VRRLFSILVLLPLLARPVFSAETEPSTTPPTATATVETKPVAELSASDAVVLGLVEGITEYLPISSTGHLIIATQLLHLNSETPLNGKNGEPLWFKKPSAKHPAGEALTPKLAADTYTVVIQFGAIAAVALLYWRQVRVMILGLLGRDPVGLKLVRNLLIAFLPAAVIGLLLSSWIESMFSITAVLTAQVSGAVLMLLAEGWRKKQPNIHADRDPSELSGLESLSIGLLQCLALWPGMSRSMTTIVGGYFVGLNPKRSAEFSFLLGLVTLSAATVYKSYKSGAAMLEVYGWSHILLGCVVAAVTAAVAVKFLINYLTRHGLVAFAIYRFVLAGVLGLLLARGFF
jgi:undecaprenyl-diphosphatase